MFQSVEDYINTVNEHKEALNEIKNFIVDEAFNSGTELKDWLDSFGFGRNNMMWPIPTIRENKCEICVTFYYLPQIVTKNSTNQFPRPFPLPSNPINITWENGFPKIESNWKFELFPQPPVTICYRKNKPECRPNEPPPICTEIPNLPRPPEGEFIWDEIDLNPFPPPCMPSDSPVAEDFSFPVGEPGKVYEITVFEESASKSWGIIESKDFYIGIKRERYKHQNSSPKQVLTRKFLSGPLIARFPRNENWNEGCFGAVGRRQGYSKYFFLASLNSSDGVGISQYAMSTSCNNAHEFDSKGFRRVDIAWGYTFRTIEIKDDTGKILDFPYKEDPKPNPPINQENQMQCCEECLKILRKLDRDMTRLMKWTGAATGGFEVPEHLHDRSPGSDWLSNAWDAITPDKTIKLNSMPEYYRWQLEKLQEFFGTFPIVFGDDKDNEVAFPTIANAFQAIAMKQVAQEKVLSVIEKGVIKNILETGFTRQQTILITSLLNALTDYFEMTLQDSTEPVEHNFTALQIQNMSLADVDEQDIWLQFLENQEFQAKVVRFNPNEEINGRKPETFSHTARRILQILEILKAAHTVPINQQMPDIDVRRYIGELRKFYKGLTLDNRDLNNNDSPDLSQFFNKVEQQFGAEINPPTNSTTAPWGQNLHERPKIVIKGDGAPADSDG